MSKPRVLVVDDDDDLRSLLAAFCESMGAEVHEACNGFVALKMLLCCEAEYELVLLDMCMPVMSGAELLAFIRHDPTISLIPVVLITAGRPTAEESKGADVTLTKPPNLGKLHTVIRRFLRPEPDKETAT